MTSPETIRTIFFEQVKVRCVQPNLYRICDLNGQGSQYADRFAIPKPVREQADGGGVAISYGYINANGRWSVRTRAGIEGMRTNRHFK